MLTTVSLEIAAGKTQLPQFQCRPGATSYLPGVEQRNIHGSTESLMRLSKALQSIGRFSLEHPNLEAVFHMPPPTRQRVVSMVMWGVWLHMVRELSSLATLRYNPFPSSRIRFYSLLRSFLL